MMLTRGITISLCRNVSCCFDLPVTGARSWLGALVQLVELFFAVPPHNIH